MLQQRRARGSSSFPLPTVPVAASKVAIVTGGGRGIGAATAARFVRGGWRVALLDRDATTLAAFAQSLGPACVWHGVADVSDYAALVEVADRLKAVAGRADVLVNNAGILFAGPFETIAPADAEQQIRVNLLGVVNATYAFFEQLKTTPGARIVNIASASSIYGTPDFAVYSATKFAVRGLTEALDIEFRRHDIRVCDLSPPFVASQMLAMQHYVAPGIARLGGAKMQPDDVARWVWRAANAKPRRVHYTLQTDQRLLRCLSAIPALARPVMARFMGYARS